MWCALARRANSVMMQCCNNCTAEHEAALTHTVPAACGTFYPGDAPSLSDAVAGAGGGFFLKSLAQQHSRHSTNQPRQIAAPMSDTAQQHRCCRIYAGTSNSVNTQMSFVATCTHNMQRCRAFQQVLKSNSGADGN